MPKVKDLLEKIPYTRFIGNDQTDIIQLVPLEQSNTRSNVLMWVNEKNLDSLANTKHGVIICPDTYTPTQTSCSYILSANPRQTFQKVLELFFSRKRTPSISKHAVVHSSTKIGKEVFIGDFVVIEENCEIGDQVYIDHNTVIKAGSIIHNNVNIGSNCTIGGVGFGYEKNTDGQYELLQHIGNVVLKEGVDIGNNTCIDRAVLGSTILHENVKVDNLVHIAHGVTIGKNSLIIANTMIGGSTHIGENVWVAPSTSILNKKTVASNSVMGMGAVILKDVSEGQVVVGNPGKPLTK